MASAFAHIVIPVVICIAVKDKTFNFRLFALAAILSVIPDADVIAFKFGIPYESPWGHRGFSHSILFAMSVAAFFMLFTKQLRASALVIFIVCFVSCLSHALLDAMTNGGLGVALYWPLDNDRYFLPFRPIQVSPIGVKAFFTERGLRVISSELVWVFLPGLLLSVAVIFTKKLLKKDISE